MDALIRRHVPEASATFAADIVGVMRWVASDYSPALILLDPRLPGVEGVRGIQRVAQEFAKSTILLMARREDADWVDAVAKGSGLPDCLISDRPEEEIADSIRANLRPQSSVQAPRAHGTGPWDEPERLDGLTSRQRTIVRMLPSGRSNREIGSLLGICEGTVKVHLLSAYRQMGVRNRVEAVQALQSPGRSRPSQVFRRPAEANY